MECQSRLELGLQGKIILIPRGAHGIGAQMLTV